MQVRYDPDTEDVVRTATGRCIECKPNEQGYLLGPINDTDYASSWDGYVGGEVARARKIVADVFNEGDRWFRTGDMMRQDAAGYYFFGARIGFGSLRWKGELVSTVEVEACAMRCAGVPLTDACSYGVPVPHNDGSACILAISARTLQLGDSDLTQLLTHFDDELPTYAVPTFVRQCSPHIPVNDSMKHQTKALASEGWNLVHPNPDHVWVLTCAQGRLPRRYTLVTTVVVNEIETGEHRL